MSEAVTFKAQNASKGTGIELFLSITNSTDILQEIDWTVTLPKHLKATPTSLPLSGHSNIPPFQSEDVGRWTVTSTNRPIAGSSEIVAELNIKSGDGFTMDGCRIELTQLFRQD